MITLCTNQFKNIILVLQMFYSKSNFHLQLIHDSLCRGTPPKKEMTEKKRARILKRNDCTFSGNLSKSKMTPLYWITHIKSTTDSNEGKRRDRKMRTAEDSQHRQPLSTVSRVWRRGLPTPTDHYLL